MKLILSQGSLAFTLLLAAGTKSGNGGRLRVNHRKMMVNIPGNKSQKWNRA